MTILLGNRILPKTMKAAMFYKPGDVRFEDTKVPLPGAGEIVIKIEAALTCGTDLKTFRRGHPVLLKKFPSPFGHECAGTVAVTGEGVTGMHPGTRVVVANSAPCMECFFCKKRHYNLCEKLDLLNGAYAEYLKIPAQIVRYNTIVISDEVSFEAAAFAEPLAVSMRGIDACNIKPGDSVAVIGLGAIGQFMIRLAKLKGAHVTGIGRNPLKRTLAKSFGKADNVIEWHADSDPVKLVATCSPEGRGFDIVIEAVGQPEMWETAVKLARRGGLVNFFGGCESGSTISLETRRLHYDEITIVSPFHHTPEHFRKAVEWISNGILDPTPLISLELPLSCVIHALELVAEGKAVKVALKP